MTVAPSLPPTHNRRLVAWLSLGQLITWGSVFYTFALLMEPVERELGLTRAQSSLAFSLALLAEGALAYPVGRWIDRGHERAVMTGGSLLVGACLLLHSAVHQRRRLLRGVDRARRRAGRHTVHPGVRGGHAALPARLPPRHHHAHFPGRAGQHGVHPAVSLADPVAGLAPCAVGARRLPSAGVRAAACGAAARSAACARRACVHGQVGLAVAPTCAARPSC